MPAGAVALTFDMLNHNVACVPFGYPTATSPFFVFISDRAVILPALAVEMQCTALADIRRSAGILCIAVII